MVIDRILEVYMIFFMFWVKNLKVKKKIDSNFFTIKTTHHCQNLIEKMHPQYIS